MQVCQHGVAERPLKGALTLLCLAFRGVRYRARVLAASGA